MFLKLQDITAAEVDYNQIQSDSSDENDCVSFIKNSIKPTLLEEVLMVPAMPMLTA
jgi:hypothetical protein